MNKQVLFYGGIILGIIFIIAAVYYYLPGHYHPLASGDAYARHMKHTAGFTVLAIICFITAVANRPKKVTN